MKKRIAWWVMSAGLGEALLFVLIVIQDRQIPPWSSVYVMPATGVLIGATGWVWLRRLYRAEPLVAPAAGSLSLADFICATVFAGGFGALAMVLIADAFKEGPQHLAPALGITGFALYLQGVLAASFRGIQRVRSRCAYSIAHVALTIGLTGALSIVTVCCIVWVMGGIVDLEFIWSRLWSVPSSSHWILLMRACCYALPVGAVLMAAVQACVRTNVK